jgi:hypothetical protein
LTGTLAGQGGGQITANAIAPTVAKTVGDIGNELAEAAADDRRKYVKLAQEALVGNNLAAVAEYEAKAQEADAIAAKWDENGVYRVALHAATQGMLGSLAGGRDGALTSAAGVVGGNLGQQLAAELGNAEADKLGLSDGARKAFVNAFQQTGAVVGGMVAGATAGSLADHNADVGSVLAAAQGGQAAETVDTYNRQLHYSTERPLIKQLAEKMAAEFCKDNSDCRKNAFIMYGDALERVAKGMVDDKENANNTAYLRSLMEASQSPTSEGGMGNLALYVDLLSKAREALSKYAGQPMFVNGKSLIGKDGKPLTYFSATKAERADEYSGTLMGGKPDAIVFGAEARNQNRLDYFAVQNGSAKKDYLLEETLLGGKVVDKTLSALGKLWMGLDGALGYEAAATVKENVSRVASIVDKDGKILSTGSVLPSNVGKSSLTKPAADRQITEASSSSASMSNSVKPATEGGANGVGQAAGVSTLEPGVVSYARNGSRNLIDQRLVSEIGEVACGPTSCAMIMGDRGLPVNISNFAKEAGIGVDGTDVLGLAKAMQNNGVSAARWRNGLSIDELASATSKGNSAIVQMDLANSSHFIVVDGVTRRAALSSEALVAIRDPWKGTQYFLPQSEFNKKFTGWGVLTNPNKP